MGRVSKGHEKNADSLEPASWCLFLFFRSYTIAGLSLRGKKLKAHRKWGLNTLIIAGPLWRFSGAESMI